VTKKKVLLLLGSVITLFFFYNIFSTFVFTVGKWFPGITTYTHFPNVMGGCIDRCEGKEYKLLCTGSVDNYRDSFASCTYLCLGRYYNICRGNN
jgi:hypothetical protein